mmetsp:Transcript_16771/g.47877  ORF Transcript_16771/g.47877 Transcript_16771/m.47877 type:complete len:237 (+) Transcript_16771:786-1496(+)
MWDEHLDHAVLACKKGDRHSRKTSDTHIWRGTPSQKVGNHISGTTSSSKVERSRLHGPILNEELHYSQVSVTRSCFHRHEQRPSALNVRIGAMNEEILHRVQVPDCCCEKQWSDPEWRCINVKASLQDQLQIGKPVLRIFTHDCAFHTTPVVPMGGGAHASDGLRSPLWQSQLNASSPNPAHESSEHPHRSNKLDCAWRELPGGPYSCVEEIAVAVDRPRLVQEELPGESLRIFWL